MQETKVTPEIVQKYEFVREILIKNFISNEFTINETFEFLVWMISSLGGKYLNGDEINMICELIKDSIIQNKIINPTCRRPV